MNHFGLSSGKGCRPCNCDVAGSADSICEPFTGQCVCRPGVGGLRCETCLSGFFAFSENGCKACDVCEHAGHICHPETGRCVCPPNTEGPQCQSCSPQTWGYRPALGCQLCECDSGGKYFGNQFCSILQMQGEFSKCWEKNSTNLSILGLRI